MKGLAVFSTMILASALSAGALARGQEPSTQQTDQTQGKVRKDKKKDKSTVADVGGGVGSAAGGVGKGAGHAAEGVGKGAADAVTLHPLNAVGDVGTGAAKAGKDVTVGSAKGVGKIGKGVGHAFRKIF
jgi:hypothetical protein